MKRLSIILVALLAFALVGCERGSFDYNDPQTEIAEDATEEVDDTGEDDDAGGENEGDEEEDGPGIGIDEPFDPEDGEDGEGETDPGDGRKTSPIKRIGKPSPKKYPRPLVVSDKRTDCNNN